MRLVGDDEGESDGDDVADVSTLGHCLPADPAGPVYTLLDAVPSSLVTHHSLQAVVTND